MPRSPRKHRFFAWIGAGLLLLLLVIPVRLAWASASSTIVAYHGAWSYRWGDSPRDAEGRLEWSLPSAEGFSPLAKMSAPQGRGGQRFLWIRTRLEGHVDGDEPVLYLRGVDQIFEAYLDGALVYRFGEFEGTNALRFLGYKPHFIPIGKDFGGKTLTLRVHSDHVNIGPFGTPALGSRAELALAMIREDMPTFGMGLILMSIGFFVLVLFFAERKQRTNLSYGTFAFLLGVYLPAAAPIRGLLIDAPLAWVHVELAALYLMPIAITAYFMHVFGEGRYRIVLWLRRIHTAYFILAALVVLLGVATALQTLLPFQILLLVSIAVMIVRAIIGAWRGDLDARIFGVGFVLAGFAGAYDVFKALGIISRDSISLGHAGMFCFTISMGVILVRRFVGVHEQMNRAVRLELETAHQKRRLDEQGALLSAAERFAKGDLETPIVVDAASEFSHLAGVLESMRRDVGAKVRELEQKKAEALVLTEELRRKIQQHTETLLWNLQGGDTYEDEDDLVGAETTFAEGSIIAERYRITGELGQGAMGMVYEVERLRDGKRLAAKVLTARGDKLAVTRFVREAQILARLDHPNLASIADVDVTPDGMLYLVMELCDGKPLSRWKERYRDLRFALPVLQQMAEGLAAVHAQGVIHRDLKPGNVMVALSPRDVPLVKLVDFGISTLTVASDERAPNSERTPEPPPVSRRGAMLSELDPASRRGAMLSDLDPSSRRGAMLSDFDRPPPSRRSIPPPDPDRPPQSRRSIPPPPAEVTRTGILVGTPTYMAPELSKGSRYWKAHSDVFGLGVIAYEILTAKRPFNVPPIFLGMQGQALPKPGGLRQVKGLHPAIVDIFERSMAADPERRPTAREIADVLARHGVEGLALSIN